MTDTEFPNSDFPQRQPIRIQPAADVTAPQVGETSQITFTYPIRQPEGDYNEFQVGVRASVLQRCRRRLSDIAKHGFPLAELLLGISTLAAGAALSAVISEVQLESARGIAFFIMAPVVSIGTGVAYGMLRAYSIRTARHLAEDVLEDLPDPDKTIEVGRQ